MGETICGYEVHPACSILPMMPAAALEELAEDIKRHGQQQPVVLFEGKVLDGRNRLKACELAGVEPEVREWRGDDPMRWVLSLNFHRRHLTEDQKSVVGARAEQLIAERARRVEAPPEPEAPPPEPEAPPEPEPAAEAPAPEPEPPKPKAKPSDRSIERQARKTAAALVNVSARRIARGRKLLDSAVPDLVSIVERGDVTIAQAARIAKLPPEAQEELVAEGPEAIVNESRRLAQAQRPPRPGFQKALAILDTSCTEWTLTCGADGLYTFEGNHDGATIRGEGRDMKAAVLEAWAALKGPEEG